MASKRAIHTRVCPESRTRKWTGIVLCTIALAVAALSFIRAFWYSDQHGTTMLIRGEIAWYPRGPITVEPYGWHCSTFPPGPVRIWPQISWPSIYIPCWLPTLLVGSATSLLWYHDRKHTRCSADSCQNCGYNLTGNTTGVCPECGGAIIGSAITAAGKSGPNIGQQP